MAVILPNGGSSLGLRAYGDPVIFHDERVLKTLLKKEARYIPQSPNYFQLVQTEVEVHMRKNVADWMVELCEDQQAPAEIFCLAMNYFDRFLSVCVIASSQLQLLGAVCLLVAWKVREHAPISASRLVQYSAHNITHLNIMEWEVLLLSKLDWDVSSVIAFDFVEHIIQRIHRLNLGLNTDLIRSNAETLITMCSSHHTFYSSAPSLVAAACVLTTLRPMIEGQWPHLLRDTPSPSSCSSGASSTSSPAKLKHLDLELVLDEVERITLIEKGLIRKVMDQVELLTRSAFPPSPLSSPLSKHGSSLSLRGSKDKESDDEEGKRNDWDHESNSTSLMTPTKVLDVDRKY
eukprot:maker-scaffold96_size378025-snap-gene-1.19 protein:Tk04964 transcript:maker-scaffold96_size378025-snap-gene-1.19-mRNA-1 annotation:"g1 s-specific cyclin-d3"